MRELNGVKIIGIDHGYGNIKSSCTVTPIGLFKYETEPVFSGNILEYNGTYYRVGEGHKEFIADKSTDNEYYIFTLMAIARELSRVGITSANVHIAAGLPLTWVRSQREEQFVAQIVEAVEKALRGFTEFSYFVHSELCQSANISEYCSKTNAKQ